MCLFWLNVLQGFCSQISHVLISSFLIQYEIAECLEETVKIHGEVGEGLSLAAGLIYQLATLQAVIRNIERYKYTGCYVLRKLLRQLIYFYQRQVGSCIILNVEKPVLLISMSC